MKETLMASNLENKLKMLFHFAKNGFLRKYNSKQE